MRHRLWFFSLLGVAAWLLLPTRAWAATPTSEGEPGQVVFGENFVLPAGETLNGDLVVFGGSATLEAGSEVRGAVAIIGGSLDARGDIRDEAVIMGGQAILAGAVGNDVVVMGGMAHLKSTAHIRGDLVLMGSALQREPGAVVEGRVVQNAAIQSRWSRPPMPTVNGPWIWGWTLYHRVVQGLWTGVQVLVMAALAGLAALFAPRALERTGEAAQQYPLHAGAVGLLAAVVVLVLTVVLAISIVGLPLALALLLLAALAYLLGLLSLGWLLGHRLVEAFGRTWPPVGEAALGTLLLMLLLAAVDLLGCLAWPIHAAVALLGLGAALLTYMGTRAPESTLEQLLAGTRRSSGASPSTPPARPTPPEPPAGPEAPKPPAPTT